MKKKRSLLWTVIALLLVLGYNFLFGGNDAQLDDPQTTFSIYEDNESIPTACVVSEDGLYYTKTEVAEYIHQYGHLPDNYITKSKAEKAGWRGGSVGDVLPGMCIGGDYFGNYEGNLPEGKKYTECDVNCPDDSRGGERLVFSSDGWIYYTADHYETFSLLYRGKD